VEKLIYPVWCPESLDGDRLRDNLLAAAPRLLACGQVYGLRIAVADSAVAPAATKRMASSGPLPDGVVSIWMDRADNRQPLEQLLGQSVERYSCYLASEAEPLLNREHPAVPGERVYGMCQVVFLQRPARLGQQQWLAIWKDSHTQVAIDTQSTFGYRQNVLQRPLSPGAAALDAMIEENFPPEAMTSDHAFYGVQPEDDEGLQVNLSTLLSSCARFIDFDKIDVIPMSEYVIKPLAGP
jgi:hypothetical protein